MWTYSTQHCNSTTIGLLRYVSLLYSFSVDLMIYKETFSPWQILGAIVVLIANISTMVYKVREEREKKQLEPI